MSRSMSRCTCCAVDRAPTLGGAGRSWRGRHADAREFFGFIGFASFIARKPPRSH